MFNDGLPSEMVKYATLERYDEIEKSDLNKCFHKRQILVIVFPVLLSSIKRLLYF